VVPQVNGGGTYAEAPGTTENANFPLYPFKRDSQGNFHTAVSARQTKNFAYSYPEVIDWGITPQQLASNVRKAFKTLYNPTGMLDNQKRSIRITRRADRSTQTRDWFINLKVNRTMDTPISINFFLGPPPARLADWQTASNLIGSQIILPDMTSSKLLPPALAQIPVTRSLSYAVENGQLNSTDVPSIQTFLAAQLHWTVSTSTGEIMEPSSLADLQISILDQTVESTGAADQFDLYGALNNHTSLAWSSS
jgi:tyrosinase